jgi:hypothetical protein
LGRFGRMLPALSLVYLFHYEAIGECDEVNHAISPRLSITKNLQYQQYP